MNAAKKEGWAFAFNGNKQLRELINNQREQQHSQANNDDPATSGAVFMQPERQHQAAHCYERAGVKGAVVGQRDQPQECMVLNEAVIEEVENCRVQRKPESMIDR